MNHVLNSNPKFVHNCSIAHALSRRLLISKTRVQSQGKKCGICGEQNVIHVRIFLHPFRLSILITKSVLRDHLSDLFRWQTGCALVTTFPQGHIHIPCQEWKKISNNDSGFNEQITILTWPHKRKNYGDLWSERWNFLSFVMWRCFKW